MCTLDSFLSRMGFTVAITVFSMATLAFIGVCHSQGAAQATETVHPSSIGLLSEFWHNHSDCPPIQ